MSFHGHVFPGVMVGPTTEASSGVLDMIRNAAGSVNLSGMKETVDHMAEGGGDYGVGVDVGTATALATAEETVDGVFGEEDSGDEDEEDVDAGIEARSDLENEAAAVAAEVKEEEEVAAAAAALAMEAAMATEAAGTAMESLEGPIENMTKRKRNRGADKRKAWSLAEKKEVCRRFRDGGYKSQSKFLRDLNAERAPDDQICASNFQKWWTQAKNGVISLEELTTETDDRLKRRRVGRFDAVERKLAEYVADCESGLGDGIPGLAGPRLQEMARRYAEECGDLNFKASATWLQKFRQRYGLQKYLLHCVEGMDCGDDGGEAGEDGEGAMGSPRRLRREPITADRAREALSTLSAFAAQENQGWLALDIARLQHRVIQRERKKKIKEAMESI